MNNMEKIAEMFDIELEEEFTVELFKEDRFKFTADGLFVYSRPTKTWERSLFMTEILTGEFEIIKLPKPILTEKEKEYLSAVIKPFRDEVKHISKNKYDNEEWIQIRTKQGLALLPPFKEGLMYNGMELGKEYSVKELDA